MQTVVEKNRAKKLNLLELPISEGSRNFKSPLQSSIWIDRSTRLGFSLSRYREILIHPNTQGEVGVRQPPKKD